MPERRRVARAAGKVSPFQRSPVRPFRGVTGVMARGSRPDVTAFFTLAVSGRVCRNQISPQLRERTHGGRSHCASDAVSLSVQAEPGNSAPARHCGLCKEGFTELLPSVEGAPWPWKNTLAFKWFFALARKVLNKVTFRNGSTPSRGESGLRKRVGCWVRRLASAGKLFKYLNLEETRYACY